MTAIPDPYGIDLALTPDGDLQVTPAGDAAAISGPANCGQAIAMRLRTVPGELSLHPEYGSTLTLKIGDRSLDDTLATASATTELRRVLSMDRRYAGATSIAMTAAPSDPSRQTLSFQLQLTGGEQLLVPDAGDPRADEISVTDAPAQGPSDPLALSEVGDFNDPSDELPELADLLGDDDASAPSDDLSVTFDG